MYASTEGNASLPVVTENILQDWELKEQLGIGSTSTVYKCVSKAQPDLSCACKVINKRKLGVGKARQEAMIKLAKNEVDLMARLDHECIVRLLGSYETQKDLYVVTELMTGGELLDVIMDVGVLSDTDALKVVRRIGAGVLHLHKIGIMHRDIKPENILLKTKEDLNSVKLIDFGLSKDASTTKSFIGTQGYLAPEMSVNRRQYTPAVDMWALGVTMYAVMTGHLPFDDDQEAENQKTGKIQASFPSDMWAGRDPRAIDCIKKLLLLDPKKRLSAEQLCNHQWLLRGLVVDEGKEDSARQVRSMTFTAAPEDPAIKEMLKNTQVSGSNTSTPPNAAKPNSPYVVSTEQPTATAVATATPAKTETPGTTATSPGTNEAGTPTKDASPSPSGTSLTPASNDVPATAAAVVS
jgi:serine/threonine protein kinase